MGTMKKTLRLRPIMHIMRRYEKKDTLFATLNDWVDRYYRDRLTQVDLADPQLLREGREALDRLTQILRLGSVYPFQQ